MGTRVSGKWLTRMVGRSGSSAASRGRVASIRAWHHASRLGYGSGCRSRSSAPTRRSGRPGPAPRPWCRRRAAGTCSRRAGTAVRSPTGPPAPVHTGYGSSGVTTPSPRHSADQVPVARLAAQRHRVAGVRPQLVVAGHPDDGAEQDRSVRSVHSMSATFSATSPATSSQSPGDPDGRSATHRRFRGCDTCRSLMARLLASPGLVASIRGWRPRARRPATRRQGTRRSGTPAGR